MEQEHAPPDEERTLRMRVGDTLARMHGTLALIVNNSTPEKPNPAAVPDPNLDEAS